MIAKNGIDWNAMGFTVYGECPEYKSTLHKSNKAHRDKTRNISYLTSYRLWARLLRIDRGTEYNKSGILCEEWKDFDVFDKWYEENYYNINDEKMELTYKLYDFDNDLISPHTTCFLPQSINHIFYKPHYYEKLAVKLDEYKEMLPTKIYECLKNCLEGYDGEK